MSHINLVTKVVLIIISVCIVDCHDERVEVVEKTISPDSLFNAIYSVHSYGGAAGSVSHIISINQNENMKEIVLDVGHVDSLKIEWKEIDFLLINLFGGDIRGIKEKIEIEDKYGMMHKMKVKVIKH